MILGALLPFLAVAVPIATADDAELSRLVAEDVARPVRPAGVDGQAFWNGNAVWFMYPPSFDFPEAKGAAAYRFRVFDSAGKVHDFHTKTPKESLTEVWTNLPPGRTEVWCEGYAAGSAWSHALNRSFRSFWKMAPFRPGTYPKPPRSYAEAAKLGYGYILSLPCMRKFAETGRPDPSYSYNCYPSKIHSAVVRAMLRYAALEPSRRAEALKLAQAAADYLLSVAQGEDAPLAGFTPTYEGKEHAAAGYAGQNMLVYPASAGGAFVAMYRETKEEKYLAAARRIAATYMRLQGEDGTWYLKLWEKDGRPVTPNRLLPMSVIDFMDEMFAVTGEAAYRDCSDRAFAFIERGPLRDWNWEGQFEDVEPTAKYVNLTKHSACSVAIRLVKRWPGDARRLAQARELLRYAEDQFVAWEMPYKAERISLLWKSWERWLVEPAVVEQYYYRQPIDSSAAKLIRTYLALYAASGNPLDLAKARALGDACVRTQRPDGRIPTVWTEECSGDPRTDWVNCMISALGAIERADAAGCAAGWTGATHMYVADATEPGVLRCEQARIDEWKTCNLYTEREYGDFVLSFECNMAKGANNGVGIRMPKKIKGEPAWESFCEVQLIDDDSSPRLKPHQHTGSVYGVIPATPGPDGRYAKPCGEWSKYEIRVVGTTIEVRIDGRLATKGDLAQWKGDGDTIDGKPHPGLHRTRGRIGFLGHYTDRPAKDMIVRFRNISIREL